MKGNNHKRVFRYLLATVLVGSLSMGYLNSVSSEGQLKKNLNSEIEEAKKLKYDLDSSVNKNAELKKEKSEITAENDLNEKKIEELKSSVEQKNKEIDKLLNQEAKLRQQVEDWQQDASESYDSDYKNNETHNYLQQTELVYSMEATAYDGYGMGGLTATGVIIRNSSDKIIAVDPSVIPLGSRVYVDGYGEAIAADTGGDIVGNRIDLNMSESEAVQFGRQTVQLTILN